MGVTEVDVRTYTIKAAGNLRTLNKVVHIRLPANYLTFNEVVSLWEKKIGMTLEKIYVPEEKILRHPGLVMLTTLILKLFCYHEFIN